MKLKIYTNEEEWLEESIKEISKTVSAHDEKNIALSGGNTPKKLYKKMAKSSLPFQRINFYPIDERYVPREDKDSNFNMIYNSLIKKVPSKFFAFDTSLPYEQCLKKFADKLPENFDLTLLGIGPDGHIASLFPGSSALDEKNKAAAHTKTEKFKIKNRLTLTIPPIMGSKKILVLLKGPEKEKIIKELKNPSKKFRDFPALILLEHKNLIIHYLK